MLILMSVSQSYGMDILSQSGSLAIGYRMESMCTQVSTRHASTRATLGLRFGVELWRVQGLIVVLIMIAGYGVRPGIYSQCTEGNGD